MYYDIALSALSTGTPHMPIRFHPDLKPLMVPIDEVVQYPDNYNQGDVEAIAESIEVNGMYRPLYAQRSSRRIVAGNHTWEACKALGADHVPVVWLDIDDTQATRLLIADNRIAALARPDTSSLVALLEQLGQTALGLHGTGYIPDDLEQLTALAQMEPTYDEFATWPTVCFTIPPHLKAAFEDGTREAIDMTDKFEVLLRRAGLVD
jgi:hypothetical protein